MIKSWKLIHARTGNIILYIIFVDKLTKEQLEDINSKYNNFKITAYDNNQSLILVSKQTYDSIRNYASIVDNLIDYLKESV